MQGDRWRWKKLPETKDGVEKGGRRREKGGEGMPGLTAKGQTYFAQ